MFVVSIVQSAQKINMACNLKDNLKKEFPELKEFSFYIFGNKKQIASFFTAEPLYQILDICLKELIVYCMNREHKFQDIYSYIKGGIKGNIFEYILLDNIKSTKKFNNIQFELIENID